MLHKVGLFVFRSPGSFPFSPFRSPLSSCGINQGVSCSCCCCCCCPFSGTLKSSCCCCSNSFLASLLTIFRLPILVKKLWEAPVPTTYYTVMFRDNSLLYYLPRYCTILHNNTDLESRSFPSIERIERRANFRFLNVSCFFLQLLVLLTISGISW